MEITQKSIPHIFRNKYLKNSNGGATYIGGTSSTAVHTHENKAVLDLLTNEDIKKWNAKLDKSVWDKAFTIDESDNLRVKLNLVGEKEVSAYGAGSTGGGVITIVDNLTSTAVDCALSANQGCVLKGLIDSKSSVSSWNDITGKPTGLTESNITLWIDAASKKHEHSNKTVLDGITAAKITGWDNHLTDVIKHITSTERTNWNAAYANNHTHTNKTVLDGITSTKVSNWDGVVTSWNKAFYFDADGNLRVKINLVGEQEVSAYGAGSTGGGGAFTIVDNLTSTSTDAALSANQGRVLKSLIDGKMSSVAWNDITGKPSTFTPATHTHTIANITNLQSALDTKAAASHTHNYTSTVKVGTTAYNAVSNVISLPAYPTTLPASNVYAWAKASTKPTYTYSEVGAAASNHTHTDLKRIWNTIITVNSWSRLCSAYNDNLAGSFLLTVQYTRNSVVVNNVFLITFGHNYNGQIITLGTHDYTQIQLRLTNITANDVYVEILDNYGATTTQTVKCIAEKISCNLITYSSYTAGGGTQCAYTSTSSDRLKVNNETVMFGTDNIASATKLQTARSIWGQPFDGTGNVSGAMNNVTTIDASGRIRTNNVISAGESADDVYGYINVCRTANINNASCFSWVREGTMAFGLGFNTSNHIVMGSCGGGKTINPWMTLNSGGVSFNGLIISNSYGVSNSFGSQNASYCHYNTTAPIHWFNKSVEIQGTLKPYGGGFDIGSSAASWGAIWSSGWFYSKGATGWYSDTYGGGIYMTDTNYVRTYGTKRFYVDSPMLDAINANGGLYSNGKGGHGLTVIGDESTTTRIKGRIGSSINGVISRYEVQWYNDYARFDVHRGGSSNILKWSWKYNNTEAAQLSTTGNFVAAGEITAYSSSDKRLKKHIKSIDSSLAIIEKLNPVQFKWNKKAKELNSIKDNRINYGLIAQEVEEVLPELVHPIYDKYKSVDYEQLIPLLIQSIKELKSELDSIKNNNNTKQTI